MELQGLAQEGGVSSRQGLQGHWMCEPLIELFYAGSHVIARQLEESSGSREAF